MTRVRRGPCAAALALAILLPGAATAADAPAAVPDGVRQLLDARGADGRPVLGAAERAYFEALPDHARRLVADAVAGGLITAPAQLAQLFALELPADRIELALTDNCVLCHSNPDLHGGPMLLSTDPARAGSPPHMHLGLALADVHFRRGVACAGCHGGDPAGMMAHDFPDSWPADAARRRSDRSWIPAFCSRCHGDAAFMRGFNPALPTDQLAKYRTSRHGIRLLEQRDSRAAQCVSCHGAHGVLPAKSPLSMAHPTRIPDTCGACHADAGFMAGVRLADGSPMPTDQVEQYRSSVHGRALLERGDIGAAVCNDCHGNHAAMPPGVASVAQICRTCHAGNGALFDGSNHKRAFERHGWPECGTCHGDHAIEKTSDAMLGTAAPASLCVGCHARYAADKPECVRTAAYFHDVITGFVEAESVFGAQIEHLAERGLDVDPLTEGLAELGDTVKKARSYIHTFDRSDFQQVVVPAEKAIQDMRRLVEEAEAEYRERRTWLAVSVALIGALALLLYLKLRRIERSRPGTDAATGAGTP